MTKRDFFILLIKLFGLWTIVTTLFSAFPTSISYALIDFDLLSLIWIVVAFLVIAGLFVLLIFKADKVVGLLKLDKGFDHDRFVLGNLHAADIVKLGAFIIGGILILDNIPAFLSHTLFAFKESVIRQPYTTNDKFYWAVSGINIVLGYLLVTNYALVAKILRTTIKANEDTMSH